MCAGGGECLHGINEKLRGLRRKGGALNVCANDSTEEEANANAGVNESQWDEEAMPQNTNKLVHFCRTSLLPVFHTHISQRFSSEGPR